jgi:hypothetical protein
MKAWVCAPTGPLASSWSSMFDVQVGSPVYSAGAFAACMTRTVLVDKDKRHRDIGCPSIRRVFNVSLETHAQASVCACDGGWVSECVRVRAHFVHA